MAIDGEKFGILSTANRLIMNGKNRGNAERKTQNRGVIMESEGKNIVKFFWNYCDINEKVLN